MDKVQEMSVVDETSEKTLKKQNFKEQLLKNKWILVGFVVILVALFFGFGIFLGKHENSNSTEVIAKASPSPTPTKDDVQNKQGPLFTGTLKPISQDLGILVASQSDIDNAKLGNDPFSVNYFDAGTYTRGKYSGYMRIVALEHTENNQAGYAIAVFATKDNETFIMDSSDQYFFNTDNLNKSKTIKKDKLDFENPDIINLNSNFALSRIDFATIRDSSYKIFLLTNTAGFKELPSSPSYPYLKFYARPAEVNNTNQYIDGSTEVVVTDETGFAFFYNITTPSSIYAYNQEKQKKAPDYVSPPNLSINSSDIKNISSPFYQKYSVSFPQGCAGENYTSLIKNISDSDMVKIGSTNSFDVYSLANKNHTLYKTEFDIKISSVANSSYDKIPYETFKQVNNGLLPPTFEGYVNKNPLLFAKDYWGRWFALGEYDYNLIGGCGKPVIYLYPKKDTNVKINFQDPVSLDLSIPSYNNGWNVLAHPDGKLVDLQPQFTNCEAIDYSRLGSEYAKNACLGNQYPYIYWAGKNLTKTYPRVDYGWIVAKENLNGFMDRELSEIGLTKKEKADMMEYWIPEMLSKNVPFYRISFLTASQMNEIIPMNISPKPDKLYRLFLDYLPLYEKPNLKMIAPTIPKIAREGFTVVEWGGLLR